MPDTFYQYFYRPGTKTQNSQLKKAPEVISDWLHEWGRGLQPTRLLLVLKWSPDGFSDLLKVIKAETQASWPPPHHAVFFPDIIFKYPPTSEDPQKVMINYIPNIH